MTEELQEFTQEQLAKKTGLERYAETKMHPKDGQRHNNAIYDARQDFETRLVADLQKNEMYQFSPAAVAANDQAAVAKKNALVAEVSKHMKSLDEQIADRVVTGGEKQGDPELITETLGTEKQVSRQVMGGLLGSFLGSFSWLAGLFTGAVNNVADWVAGFFSPGSAEDKDKKKTAAGIALAFAERPIEIEGVAYQPNLKVLYNQAVSGDLNPAPAAASPATPTAAVPAPASAAPAPAPVTTTSYDPNFNAANGSTVDVPSTPMVAKSSRAPSQSIIG